jgi:hypothetical protein
MFNGALTEWFPTSGVSWQVPQNPAMLGLLSTSLSPVTPVILIALVLNRRCPFARGSLQRHDAGKARQGGIVVK